MHVKPKPKRPAEDWRLQDSEFDELHEQLRFTHEEGCCDDEGKNGHAYLPLDCEKSIMLKADLSG